MEKKNKNKLTVKYDNELNRVAFHRLNAKELNLFFTLAAKLKEQKERKIIFSFNELKKIIQFEPTCKQRFIIIVENLNKKMLTFTLKSDDGNIIENYVLFTGYKINRAKQELEVSVNPDLMYLINNLVTREYTLFEHQEFVNIKSTYAKNCYRLLKQFRSTGFCKLPIEKFRDLLAIPKNYNMSQIDCRVLKYIKKELDPLFKNLIIKKIKNGKNISFLEFTFDKKMKTETTTCTNNKNSLFNLNKLKLKQNQINLNDEVVWD